MLSRLVKVSIRFRGVIVVLACGVIAYGIYTAQRASYDVYPEFVPPQVVVQTEAPGLSPGDVETLVTRPVENALNGMPDLESIRSQSIQGLSVVTVVFEDKTDLYRARQMVSERMAEAAGQMPQGVEAPAMAPLTTATGLTLIVGITSDKRSSMDLRTFADWTLRPRLLAVPGVARVSIFGGEVKQLQIQIVPERLAAFDLSLSDVINAARAATGVRGAGFVDTESQRILLETRGQSWTPAQIGEVVLAVSGGRSVRMKDVARIAEGAEPKPGDATIMGQSGVILLVSAQYGANTVKVTEEIEKALDELKPALSSAQITLHPSLFRPANFVTTAIRNIGRSLLIGAVFVAVVLLLFLFDLRAACISLTAIPLSLLMAVIVLDWFGMSLNTLTLGGLAIAIGAVVDDAIIDVENIFRRLRESGQTGGVRNISRIVLDACVEVYGAVVYATLIIAIVFLPVLTMSGIQGRLFAPLGWAYILAILASLLVALTVTPALSFLLLPKAVKRAKELRYVAAMKSSYRQTLTRLSRRPGWVIAAAVLLCLLAAGALPFLGGSFLPDLREGHFIVHMSALPGTSLAESVRMGKLITPELLKNPDIQSVAQQIGRAELADDTWGTHYSEVHVALKPLEGEGIERAESAIRETFAKFPGASFSVKSFLGERIEEIISGSTAQVVIKVFGDDLDEIDKAAGEIVNVTAAIRGAADVIIESPAGTPEMVIQLRPDRLRQFGFQPVNVLEAIQTAYQGSVVGQVYEANRVFNVSVILEPEIRRDPEGVGALSIQNAEGLRVPLRELAQVYETTGRYSIAHEGTRRRQTVTCNVRGRDLSSFVTELQGAIAKKIKFPAGVYAVFSGASEARTQARSELLTYSLIAGTGILVLLSIVFRNLRNTLLVLANLPFALVGGVLAAFLTGGDLSVGSMVGFVSLFGITMRNSIMMISHFEHLVQHEGETWNLSAAMRGAAERLNPILMTAIVTALGLLPMAVGSGQPGREIDGPMAVVILGGLVTSTALNLLVLPTLALRYGKFERSAED
jgi:CzcA family heavy metal efflux pump